MKRGVPHADTGGRGAVTWYRYRHTSAASHKHPLPFLHVYARLTHGFPQEQTLQHWSRGMQPQVARAGGLSAQSAVGDSTRKMIA